MRIYWQCIEGMGGFKGQALRLHLLTGGQRIEQLVKAKRSSPLADCITLLDGKGRPGKAAREHTVPLVGSVLEDVEALRAGKGEWLLSTDGGKSHLGATTLSAWAKAAAGDKIKDFQAKRIRSGVETLLASARLSRDQRGRLQSHGVGGVQATHYDAHDYLPEKREALETLRRLLDQVEQPSNVVLLRANG